MTISIRCNCDLFLINPLNYRNLKSGTCNPSNYTLFNFATLYKSFRAIYRETLIYSFRAI